MPAVLPTTSSEITAEWMTEALRESGTIGPDVTVAEVLVDAGAVGVGFMGEVAVVGLVYSGDAGDAPATIVAKFPTQSPDIRAMMQPTRIYEREHRFYSELADQSPIRTPYIHHVTCATATEASDERYMLLLEDLAGLQLGDQVAGVTPEQARAALVGLAAHHAEFWNGVGLEDADFIPVINGPLNQAGSAIYESSLPGFMAAFGEVIRPELADFVDELRGHAAADPRRPGGHAAHARALRLPSRQPLLRSRRIDRRDRLAGDQPGRRCRRRRLLPVAEPEYRGSTRTRTRRCSRAYHDALVANGVSDYTYDQLVADYRVGIACGWMIPVLAVGSLDFTSERAVTLWTAVIERAQNALLDHGFGS